MSEPESIPQEVLDAQARLEERRRTTKVQVNPDKVQVNPDIPATEAESDASITAPLLRIMQTMPPERKEEGELFFKRLKLERAKVLFDSAHCPKRHTKTVELDRTGPWAEREKALAARLGTGFLIGMVGTRGCGKTQLAVELIRQRTASINRALYCTAMEFFMDIKAGYGSKSSTSEKDIIEKYTRPELLVIDEMGKRGDTEWENRLLYELINRRYNEVDDTLILSNQETADFEAALGPSIVSRMRETGGIIECNWETYRK